MFPTLTIPAAEREKFEKDFRERLYEHRDDVDGVQPYDWREEATYLEAIRLGFLENEFSAGVFYTWWKHRGDTVTDPKQPAWELFRQWALEVLNGPSSPAPTTLPAFDAVAYQAGRVRRASE